MAENFHPSQSLKQCLLVPDVRKIASAEKHAYEFIIKTSKISNYNYYDLIRYLKTNTFENQQTMYVYKLYL